MKFIRTAAISFVFVAIVGTQAAPAGAQVLDSAAASLANGQAWHATQLLRPVLADSATRTPRAVLLAARAAAAWRGWATVRTLLNGQPWIDSIGDEIGHRLLAEAALIGSHNDEALVEARRAARAPNRGAHRTPFEQAHREVLLAQAFEANDLLDSAAIHYRRAMERVPELADWLALRAAAVTTDSAQRARLYDGVALPAALERIPWTEAQARERTGDLTGAASQYRQLGAVVRAISLAWRDATSDPGRRALAGDLARIIDDPRTSITAVRAALDVVDDVIPPFTTAQWLLVARRAGKVGRSQDAVDAFATISRHTRLSARDRIAYGTALGALQRWDDAAAEFKGISAKSVAGIAAYFRARALLRSGRTAASITALHRIVRQFPHDAKAAGTALFLLADLALDSGHPDSARAFYRQLGARYPTSTYRAHAILLAAVIAFALDHPEVTARELSVAIAHHRTVAEHDAARYWLARAQSRLGDTSKAKTIWRELVADGPDNYYAVRAAARLDTMPWSAPAASAPPPDSLDGVFARAALLDQLGLADEATLERDHLASQPHDPAARVRVAQAFLAHGFATIATRLAGTALAHGWPRDAAVWRLLYPLPFARTLELATTKEALDPYLVAALIRQESGWNPEATSRTGARGLMQIQPSTGRQLAKTLGFSDFDPALLWVPQVNMAFGAHHLATAMDRYPDLMRSVAAYNAGARRVNAWSAAPFSGEALSRNEIRDPLADVDLFVERIPYTETRNYVRAIIRNEAVYRMLYPALAQAGAGGVSAASRDQRR